MTHAHPSSSIVALYRETRHFLSVYLSHTSHDKKALILRLSHPGAHYQHHTLEEMLHQCLIPLALHLHQQHLVLFTHPPYTEIEIFLRYFTRHDPYLLLNNLARGTFSFPRPEVISVVNVPKPKTHKKHSFPKPLLLLLLLPFTAMSYFIYYQFQPVRPSDVPKNAAVLSASTSASAQVSLPIRLEIPAIQVNAIIEQVGTTPEGAMAVPSDTKNVGWYNLGPHPGEHGSAVIAGHYDGIQGTKGVFEKLHMLKAGDKLYVEDMSGKRKSFIVRQSRSYNPNADASVVFGQSSGNHLNLITCEGIWDQTQKRYSKRLVIFADASRDE
jgi:LPXTG-site transpeptidase (sortase) family protein